MSLFGAPAAAAGGDASVVSGNLLEFKAGKMTLENNTVTPKKERGKIILKRGDMGNIDFVWSNRGNGVSDSPIVLFPGDAQFRKCKSCKDGRVVYLKLANRREFFWLQESDASKDEDLIKKTDDIINGRQVSGDDDQDSSAPAASTASHIRLPADVDPEMRALIESIPDITQEDVDSMLGLPSTTSDDATPMDAEPAAAAPEAPAASEPAAASSATPALDEDLVQGLLAGIANAQAQRGALRPGADLTDILTPAAVEPLLADPATVQSLLPFLPAGSNATQADVMDNIRSPQFSQALHSFSAALNSGEFNQAMAQLGVDPAAAAAAGGGVAGLVAALQKQAADAKPEPMDQSDD